MTIVAGPLTRQGARRRSAPERFSAVPVRHRAEPWGRGTLLVLLVLVALGLTGMVVGWAGMSENADLEEQARWLGLAIGSLILAGVGMVAWLVAGLVSLARLRHGVLRDLALRHPEPPARRAQETAPAVVGRLGIAAGMRRYHRGDCDVLVGKDVRWLDAGSSVFVDALPCGMCRPDEVSVR